VDGTTPSPEWIDECQRFDDVLRDFDVTLLRRALDSAEGGRLLSLLEASKQQFEAAFTEVRDGLRERMNGARKHRLTLSGYRSAGDHQRGGPKFIATNL
jgi:hypothetical protein